MHFFRPIFASPWERKDFSSSNVFSNFLFFMFKFPLQRSLNSLIRCSPWHFSFFEAVLDGSFSNRKKNSSCREKPGTRHYERYIKVHSILNLAFMNITSSKRVIWRTDTTSVGYILVYNLVIFRPASKVKCMKFCDLWQHGCNWRPSS